jgi:hypothetical protein
LEYRNQGLFLYSIGDLFVDPSEEKLSLEIQSITLNPANGLYGVEMSFDSDWVEIWQDFEYGTVILFHEAYYLREDIAENIPNHNP